jgi:hypothetical protein
LDSDYEDIFDNVRCRNIIWLSEEMLEAQTKENCA